MLSKWNALAQNISESMIVRGGSTITEQYIKNTYFSRAKRTYLEKGKEALLAVFLTVLNDKESILRDYLNSVYFGNRIYGVDTAIQTYFSKSSLTELSKEEIVTLLALIKYPGITSLENNDFLTYRNQVKKRLGWTNNMKLES